MARKALFRTVWAVGPRAGIQNFAPSISAQHLFAKSGSCCSFAYQINCLCNARTRARPADGISSEQLLSAFCGSVLLLRFFAHKSPLSARSESRSRARIALPGRLRQRVFTGNAVQGPRRHSRLTFGCHRAPEARMSHQGDKVGAATSHPTRGDAPGARPPSLPPPGMRLDPALAPIPVPCPVSVPASLGSSSSAPCALQPKLFPNDAPRGIWRCLDAPLEFAVWAARWT